jgi:hypothetical protein
LRKLFIPLSALVAAGLALMLALGAVQAQEDGDATPTVEDTTPVDGATPVDEATPMDDTTPAEEATPPAAVPDTGTGIGPSDGGSSFTLWLAVGLAVAGGAALVAARRAHAP